MQPRIILMGLSVAYIRYAVAIVLRIGSAAAAAAAAAGAAVDSNLQSILAPRQTHMHAHESVAI